MVPMNCNLGGAFNDSSFGNAKAAALKVFREVFSAESDEFLEYTDNLLRDWNMRTRPSNAALRERFLRTAAEALRPQDKAGHVSSSSVSLLGR